MVHYAAWEWEWEGWGTESFGIGGNGIVKTHSRSNPIPDHL